MKKTTARLIVLAVLVMIVLNGLLISLLWNKSTNSRGYRPGAEEVTEYIIDEMDFGKETAEQFRKIAAQHHENQFEIQNSYREIKRKLNMAMISQNKEEAERLIEQLSSKVSDKERELFRFFSEVMKITSKEQQQKFGKIFRDATGAPEYGRIPLNGNSNRPPHPKH